MSDTDSHLPSNERGKTHWDGCWRTTAHHACAVEEIERLIGERDAMQRRAESAEGDWQSAEAERDRLRAALESIKEMANSFGGPATRIEMVARKALSGEPGSGHETAAEPLPCYWPKCDCKRAIHCQSKPSEKADGGT